MKIWCEVCEGYRIIETKVDYDYTKLEKCNNCNGKGYTENETIEYEAEVGKALIKKSNVLEYYGFENVDDFVKWAGDDNE